VPQIAIDGGELTLGSSVPARSRRHTFSVRRPAGTSGHGRSACCITDSGAAVAVSLS
jgi:hypothetical protein